jgi:UDP-3-O-[3-hydroxymyristoyl] glucosamine N-acyltransferase
MVNLSQVVDFFRKRKLEIIEANVNLNTTITGGKNVVEAGSGEITFISSKYKSGAEELLVSSKAPLVICDESVWSGLKNKNVKSFVVLSGDPKSLMVECLKYFFEEKITPGVHPTAIVDGATIGKNNFIGAYTVIEKGTIIGDNCVIESNVSIRSNCVVGNNVFIKSGTVIGGKGFGYVKKQDNTWENFPHFGKVIIEDNVEIGSNTCIDRGALGDTILKKGVKVDNLVHVAHNVVVGENSLLIADCMIGGSTIIGENTWVAPSTALRNGLTIGSNCVIGMGAIVIKSVEDGSTVIGNPAVPFVKKT